MRHEEERVIRVKLFGSLREFAQPHADGEVVVSAVRSLRELRQALSTHMGSKAAEILKDCAFADERSVLAADADLEGRSWIAAFHLCVEDRAENADSSQ